MKSQFSRLTASVIRTSLVILLFLVTLIFAIIQGGFLLWFIFFMLVPFILYSLLVFFTPLQNISLERMRTDGRLEAGDSLQLTMVLKRKSRLPIFFLAIKEVAPTGMFAHIDERLIRKMVVVGLKKEIKWNYSIENLARGRHELQGVQIGIADLLGWVRKTNYIEASKVVIVYPKIEPFFFERVISHDHGQFGYTSKKKQQHSTMVASVREYVPGDRMTWLHWPSFAKTGNLYTKEFEFQQSEDICVIFDSAKGTDFEGQVSFAASLLTAALQQKEQISFLGAGESAYEIEEFNSQADLEKVMYYLATIEPNTFDLRLYYEKNHMIADANALLLITSNLTAEWIELLGRAAKKGSEPIIFVVRPSNYQTFVEDEALERLAQSKGITVRYTERGQFASIGGRS